LLFPFFTLHNNIKVGYMWTRKSYEVIMWKYRGESGYSSMQTSFCINFNKLRCGRKILRSINFIFRKCWIISFNKRKMSDEHRMKLGRIIFELIHGTLGCG
jgi:hypothetical protein